jgi:hypothetical protein
MSIRAAMKQFQSIDKKAFPVIRCKAENALEKRQNIDQSNSVWNIFV